MSSSSRRRSAISFCELIMGSKTGLEAIEKTVIDRAVQKIYQPYFADPRPENMPILGDLMNALLSQHIPEADRVAQALDLYVNGSLNFFNHRTTVDISNRLVCFDIKGQMCIRDRYYLQEPSAMTPASRLPIEPDDRVLDLCAAPGGKATELGSRIGEGGMLLANDISNSRAKALLRNP